MFGFSRSDLAPNVPQARPATVVAADGTEFNREKALEEMKFRTQMSAMDSKARGYVTGTQKVLDPDEAEMLKTSPTLFLNGGEATRRHYKMLKKLGRDVGTINWPTSASELINRGSLDFVNIGNGDVMCKRSCSHVIGDQTYVAHRGDVLKTMGPNSMINWTARKKKQRAVAGDEDMSLQAAMAKYRTPDF